MASKQTKKQPAKRTEQYRKMLENTPQLCKSQLYNALYDRLKRDGRLDRFIAVVQYCSMSGLDIEASIQVICKSFPCYINERDLTPECFKEMITSYHDISVAWGYGELGDEISTIIVKNKALQLVQKTDNMDDIVKYQSVFGNKEVGTVEDNKTTVQFNLFKR